MRQKNDKNMSKLKIIILPLIILINYGCKPEYNFETDIQTYLNEKEKSYEKICEKAGQETWEIYSDKSIKIENRYRKLLSGFFNDDSLNSSLTKWIKDLNIITNDTLKRRLVIWNNMLTCAKVDLSPEIIELQNSLEKQLSENPADKHIIEDIEKGVKKLIHLRNLKAKNLGYPNYACLMLQNTGIDTTWFNKLIQIIDQKTAQEYLQIFKSLNPNIENAFIKWSDVKPLIKKAYALNNLPDIPNNKKEKLIDETLKNIGLDITHMPIQSTIVDLPSGLGGIGIAINIPNDFRTVMNPNLEFRYMLHEIGHGLHWTHVKTPSPMLKGYDYCANPTLLNGEAMAETIGKFSRNPQWMIENIYSKRQVDSILYLSKKIAPVWLRLQLVKTLFEIELYKHPNRSAADIKNALYKKYLYLDFDFNKHNNLLSLTYISYPIYEQNYLIADIISWQIHDFLSEKLGKTYYKNPEVGVYMKQYLWKDGEIYTWQEKLVKATGRDIDISNYLKSWGL